MKNKLKAKMKSKTGETIGETLIALLVSVLALTMLAGAVSAAANMITGSEKKMKDYYLGVTTLGDPSSSGLSVELKDQAGGTIKLLGGAASVDVLYSVNEAFPGKPVIAYKKSVS